MVAKHPPQIKDPALYEALLRQGASPEKAARIANAKAAGTLRHDSTRLEDRTVSTLRDEAKRIGIPGQSRMRKAELIDAIRNHG
jgi:hypothetical protein